MLRVVLLIVMLVQMVMASHVQSAAFDEGYTITYGYAYLRTGDARLSRGQNPPLTNVFIALPLLLRNDIAFPIDHPTWADANIFGFSDEFLWKTNVDRAAQLVLLARLPEMALALLLACVVYAFTRSAFGPRAAVAALLLCAFDPNFLAQGHIVGTDLGVTLFMFSAVWMWTAAMKQMSVRRAIVAGLFAGAALSSKYSAVWLGPIVILVSWIYPDVKRHWRMRLKMLVMLGLAAFVVIWSTFAFSIGPIATGGLPVPAPQYWESFGQVANRVESGTPAFMLGQISSTGFTVYYPFVFLVKTPLPMLFLLIIGMVTLILRRKREDVVVWLPPVLFGFAAMSSNLNLGYRLILPVLPFVLMIAGQGAARLIEPQRRRDAEVRRAKSPWLRVAVAGLLLIWQGVNVVTIAPDYLAYFNQLANRDRDYEVLVDSNLDWGQDLAALREWQKSHHADDVNLAYYGTARPEAYGLKVQLLPSFTLNDFGPEVDGFSAYALPPGRYAISATSLQLGLLYSHWNLYAPFKARVPEARVSRALLIYNVAYSSPELDRAVVLGPIAGDLDRATLDGRDDRQLIVKWAGDDAAVLDMQGTARYITRGGEPLIGFAPAIREALLAHSTRLGSDASGQLRLWMIDARSAVSDTLNTLENKPVFAPDSAALGLPIRFEGALSLIGYDLAAGLAQPIELVTYWRVERVPDRPQSIFVHVLDAGDQIVTQRDGLNVRLSSLEPGDVIIQHFTLDHPGAAKKIEIGLYNPSDGQRQLTDQKMDRVELTWK